jgi:hypothetical protein
MNETAESNLDFIVRMMLDKRKHRKKTADSDVVGLDKQCHVFMITVFNNNLLYDA